MSAGGRNRHGAKGLFEEETATAPRAATGAKVCLLSLSHRARDYGRLLSRETLAVDWTDSARMDDKTAGATLVEPDQRLDRLAVLSRF
jgi:hypothetical protein